MNDEYYKKLPVVALTANAVNGVKEMFISSGFNDYIAKPIELSALDRILKAWLPKELIKQASSTEVYTNDRRKKITEQQNIPTADSKLLDVETGLFYTGGDLETYGEILGVYVRKGPEKLNCIRKLYESKSWSSYVIEVHALKSSSLTIGSAELSEKAKRLELAGKSGDYAIIESNTEEMLDLYEKVLEAGKKYLEENFQTNEEPSEDEDLSALEEINEEKLTEYIEKIREACDAFDGDTAVGICEETCGYVFGGIPLKALFADVKAAAEDFEYDQAAELAEKIPEKLKGGQ